jgi:hypothetical protein
MFQSKSQVLILDKCTIKFLNSSKVSLNLAAPEEIPSETEWPLEPNDEILLLENTSILFQQPTLIRHKSKTIITPTVTTENLAVIPVQADKTFTFQTFDRVGKEKNSMIQFKSYGQVYYPMATKIQLGESEDPITIPEGTVFVHQQDEIVSYLELTISIFLRPVVWLFSTETTIFLPIETSSEEEGTIMVQAGDIIPYLYGDRLAFSENTVIIAMLQTELLINQSSRFEKNGAKKIIIAEANTVIG